MRMTVTETVRRDLELRGTISHSAGEELRIDTGSIRVWLEPHEGTVSIETLVTVDGRTRWEAANDPNLLGLAIDGSPVLTADGYRIVDGLRVWDYNLDQGTVDLSTAKDGWFHVTLPTGGSSLMNAERVCVRNPFTGEKA